MVFKIDRKKAQVVFYLFLVLFISYFTYFRHYWYPNNLFWDENYYIASSYKYLHHVFFMEPHPPLGKLFIALGEYVFHPNTTVDTIEFLSADHIRNIPKGFSFVGVRFFPVLFATFSSIVFFLILLNLSKNSYLSFLFSSFYLFENGFIVQSRGAMLEGVQLFFILLSIYYFLRLMEKKTVLVRDYFFLGVCIGLSLSVKLNSSLLFLLFPFLFLSTNNFVFRWQFWMAGFRRLLFFLIGCLLIFLSAYWIHIQLGQQLFDGHDYGASDTYKYVIKNNKLSEWRYLPQLFVDNFAYTKRYESGVPATDSNGSLFYTWPIENKTINYRWDSDNGITRYLYLVGNPVIWFSGLLGVGMGSFLVLQHFLFRKKVLDKRLFFIIEVLLVLYFCYLLAMIPIRRVMYLYHYFIPLLISLLLAFCVYLYFWGNLLRQQDKRILFLTLFYVVLIVVAYSFFSPFTYYLPLTRHDFLMRNWFWWWGMKPV